MGDGHRDIKRTDLKYAIKSVERTSHGSVVVEFKPTLAVRDGQSLCLSIRERIAGRGRYRWLAADAWIEESQSSEEQVDPILGVDLGEIDCG